MENVILAGNIEYKKNALRELQHSENRKNNYHKDRGWDSKGVLLRERAKKKKKLEAVENHVHLNWEETCHIGR